MSLEPKSLRVQIKALRDALDITQPELAEELNISASTVSRWERDYVMPPSTEIVRLFFLAEEKAKKQELAEEFRKAFLETQPAEVIRYFREFDHGPSRSKEKAASHSAQYRRKASNE